MSWYLNYRKYKKQVKKLLYFRSELEYQEEVLKTAHGDFERYYSQYCGERNIDLVELNNKNAKKVKNILEVTEASKEALIHKPKKEKPNPTKAFDQIYRSIAKTLHPDKLPDNLPIEEAIEKEEKFKEAASAMDKEDWGKLLEVADWLNIKPRTFEGIEEQIKLEIEKLKKLIENNKKMYSWAFVECETDEQRNRVVEQFLFHLFKYNVDK